MSSPSIPSPPPSGVTEGIEELRRRHGVRPLEPAEEGSSIARLPPGVYGYSHAPGQPEVPLFARKSYHSFEVHKAGDGTEYLIGFVTPEEASNLAAGQEGAAVQMFPDPWESSQTLVSVDASKIVAPKRMPRENGNPFPFLIA
jgi:hypothetical protein